VHQKLIAVTLLSPEVEVAMGHSKELTRIAADIDIRHTHGIYAAADRQ
jgi:hypothetical protein